MNKYAEEDFREGQVLLLDKPLNWTSFQMVNKVRWLIRQKFQIKKIKVGHAGTLDPLATGLLIICTGRFTKRITEFQNQEKEYTGTFTLGATTPSHDRETAIDRKFSTDHLTREKILDVASGLTGDIDQFPPVYSAVKKEGKRLYEFARSGEEVEIASRKVRVSQFEITGISLPVVEFRVVCSKGTYIRSLASDFGKNLGSGAFLSELRRTRIGSFKVEDALDIDSFANDYLSGSE